MFRNDVTAYVTGNGSYAFDVSAANELRGASVLVIYEDPSLPALYHLQVHDGDHGGVLADGSECPWPNPTNFTGFTVNASGTPAEVEVAYLIGNGGQNFDEDYLFNDTVIATPNPADSGHEWDRYDVASFFVGGETTASATICEQGDALDWQAAVLRVRTSRVALIPTMGEWGLITLGAIFLLVGGAHLVRRRVAT